MERVRITIAPPDAYLPPAYRALTRDAGFLSTVHLVNWNVAAPPAAFLIWVRGDYRRLADAMADVENVRTFEVFPSDDAGAYCFLSATGSTVGRALFENFTREDLLTVPPVECHDDGSSTFTLAGSTAAIQDAVDGVPEGVDVTVEAVGTSPVSAPDAVRSLSPRQREAVEAAVRVGYFDVPRTGTVADVATELDCARATAAEHLQKAQSRIVHALFDE